MVDVKLRREEDVDDDGEGIGFGFIRLDKLLGPQLKERIRGRDSNERKVVNASVLMFI